MTNTKTQHYIGAPNGVVLCIRQNHGGEPEGEFYQRINVATPRPLLKEALDRISCAFKEI